MIFILNVSKLVVRKYLWKDKFLHSVEVKALVSQEGVSYCSTVSQPSVSKMATKLLCLPKPEQFAPLFFYE